MRKEIIIPPSGGDYENGHPLFDSLRLIYRISYLGPSGRTHIIEYEDPYEVILGLNSFRPSDTVTHINRATGKEVFTISIKQFKLMIKESLVDSPSNLELFYGRLVLTNRYSKAIADRGKLWHLDKVLRTYLLTLRGGMDYHLSYGPLRQTTMFIKCRRPSVHFLITSILTMQEDDDIHKFYVSVPSTLANRGLLVELLSMDMPRRKFKVVTYDPVPEEGDVLIPTDISREIIQVINQLIN